jgi:hypothetical protein
MVRMLRLWPRCLVLSGAVLYAAGCLNSERLPVEALFVGPGIMFAGVVMIAGSRRRSHRSATH